MTKIENVICPFCGCLCDDLEVTVEGNEIREVKRGCAISRSLFLNHHKSLAKPMVDGEETSVEKAIEKAASILAQARFPLIYGLSSTTCEAQGKAIELAELIGGNIDSTSSVCHANTTLALQAVGEVSCTLGTVKNRADLVVFWGCNPIEAHNRHLARYSGTAKGRFIQGRKDRMVVVVDVRRTRTARMADVFLQVRPNRDYECLSTLRAILKGEKLDVKEVGGVPIETLVDLAERMKSCKFGIIFFGMGLTMTRGKHLNVSAAIMLVRDLNSFTKFAIMPMRGHFNVAGADNVLTWQTGYPYAVNFSRGYPQYGPGEFSAVDLLARREVDAALILASDPMAHFPRKAASYLEEIPTIAIDPHSNMTTEVAKVVIPTAAAGISAEGTAYRMDNIPLRLRKVVNSPYPSDEEVLGKIVERVAKPSPHP